MEAAQQGLINKKVGEAVKSYNELITEYPESELAPEAMVKLANLYQNMMVDSLSYIESYKKAESIFKKLYENYPESKQAPTALFMSGFIEANNLHQFDEATKTYRIFLEKYPDHELAESAKQELNTMGQAPDEILKQKKPKKM
jgi:TolA-binding protein